MERVFFFTLLVLATLTFVGLLKPFIVPLFWAATLAILFEPLSYRFGNALGGRGTLASGLTLIGILLLIILPLLLLVAVVGEEVTYLIAALEQGKVDVSTPIQWVRNNAPTVFEYAARFGLDPDSLRTNISNSALFAGKWLASNALQIGQNTLRFFIGLMLMIYLLFFFLRDGHSIIGRLVQILPLGDRRERQLFARFAEVVRATVKGSFLIAAIQGAIGGIAFAALGIRAAVLWGVMMALLSLLPAVGAALIWVPAAVMLLTGGELIKGITLIAIGVLAIGLVDNLLRPLLVGRDTRMPDYLVLLATLGGLAMFGISGLVIGPLIAALFITLWEMFEQSYGDQEAAQEAETSALPVNQQEELGEQGEPRNQEAQTQE